MASVYYNKRTWEDLRKALGDFTSSLFVESRNGLRWKSHAEASFSNFLHARGVQHRRGERYPDEYSNFSGRAYGFFDLHFEAGSAWIDVEIWGDRPNGHDEDGYAAKRLLKEQFNQDNPRFLGVWFNDCYDDTKLATLLTPYICAIEPHVFDRPTDRIIQSTHWSNTDELLEHCRALAAQMPDGIFPSEGWLRKRGKYAAREGPPHNTLSVYIKQWLGGVRNLRAILGQGHASTSQWDRDKALAGWKAFWQAHGLTPSQLRAAAKSDPSSFDIAVRREAARLTHAIAAYAEGAEAANVELGINIAAAYRWPVARIVEELRIAVDRWNASPHQIIYEHRTGKITIDKADFKHLSQLVDAGSRAGGLSKFYAEIGFKSPKRPRKPRRSGKRAA